MSFITPVSAAAPLDISTPTGGDRRRPAAGRSRTAYARGGSRSLQPAAERPAAERWDSVERLQAAAAAVMVAAAAAAVMAVWRPAAERLTGTDSEAGRRRREGER